MQQEQLKYSKRELELMFSKSKRSADQAFGVIYKHYKRQIFAYCITILKDKEMAEDAFQETFSKFYKACVKGATLDNIKGFLIKIARNLCLNKNNFEKRYVEFDPVTANKQVTTQNFENEQILSIVMEGIDTLPEKYREPLILKKVEGLTYKEIADLLDITVEGAKTRVTRARTKLFDIMQPYLEELKDYS
ncbi:MAG: RNA polymerase sigma-70 factor [Candidatus Kapaibacteriales bacterium]